ncbi:MAG: glycerate kinase [Bacteroidales bacterium]|nr:glycerate kinase [Bacteroidales bacterium]
MNILLAPDSFKGCLTARKVADALADGLQRACPTCDVARVSVADGGEGFCEAILSAQGGKWVPVKTLDPLGRPIWARYALCGELAVVETAAASGLPLLRPEERNPLLTTSYGTGLLIRDALERDCREFLIGLGGSATHDAGTGLLSALGFRFLDASGAVLPSCGASLGRIARIDLSAVHPALKEARFTAACDVDTPFCGPGGAAEVFAPQKGASPEQVRVLDEGTAAFAEVMWRDSPVKPANDEKVKPANDEHGYGAAGGIGGALHALLGARLKSGIDLVLDVADFDAQLQDADLVITGEGRIDAQTASGKAASGILRRAQAAGVPVVAVGGRVAPEAAALPFSRTVALADDSIPDSIALQPAWARERLAEAAASIIREYL